MPPLDENNHRGPKEQQRPAYERAPSERHACVCTGNDGVVEDRADGRIVVEDAPTDVRRQDVQAETDEHPEPEPEHDESREHEQHREEAQVGAPVEGREFSPCSAGEAALRGLCLLVRI